MLKLCFDEEVGAENVESFRKTIIRLRYPPTVLNTFAFKSATRTPAKSVRLNIPQNDGQNPVKKIVKPRLSNVPPKREGGLKNFKGSIKRARQRNGMSPTPNRRVPKVSSDGSVGSPESSQLDLSDIPITIASGATPGIDKLSSMPYCKEYARLGFGTLSKETSNGPWRISMVNLTYAACRR